MVTSVAQMVDRKARPKGETLYIDDADRKKIIELTQGRGQRAELARACDVNPAAITLLLAPFKPGQKRRGCKFLAKLQAHLGLANSAKSRPATIPREAMQRAEEVLKLIAENPDKLENWLSNGELLATKP